METLLGLSVTSHESGITSQVAMRTSTNGSDVCNGAPSAVCIIKLSVTLHESGMLIQVAMHASKKVFDKLLVLHVHDDVPDKNARIDDQPESHTVDASA